MFEKETVRRSGLSRGSVAKILGHLRNRRCIRIGRLTQRRLIMRYEFTGHLSDIIDYYKDIKKIFFIITLFFERT